MPGKVMLLAGEISGDMHGANLAKKIKELAPDVQLLGMGGRKMEGAGVKLIFDPTSLSTIGFLEAIKNLRVLKRVLGKVQETIRIEKPDVVVCIDYPGFNMRVAAIARELDIPVIFYFSPSAWAWGRDRADKVAKMKAKVASVFPFERDVYLAAGAEVEFVGHPLLDIVKPDLSKEESYKLYNVAEHKPIVGLLPGSRKQEIKHLLPIMLDAAKKVAEKIGDVQFCLPLASPELLSDIESEIKSRNLQINIVNGHAYELFQIADLVLAASGTATLEAAILGAPMVIIYKSSFSTWAMYKLLVKIPFIGLPNIVAGEMVVPEIIQHDLTVDSVADKAIDIISDPNKAKEIREKLAQAVQKLGEPGAVGRVAQMVINHLP